VPQDLFSSPPGDDEEPGSSPPPSAAEEEGDPGFTGQGLYVCLPPEQLTLTGFAQGGQADTMTPARCCPPSCTPSPARTARACRDVRMTS
jgi:hypothetical protein